MSTSSSWISAGLRTVADYFGEEEDDGRQPEYENRHANTAAKAAGSHSADTSGKRKKAAEVPQAPSPFQKKMRLKETAVNIHGSSQKKGGDASAEEKQLEPGFREKLDELKAYIAKHGHMNVNKKDRVLRAWIKIQCLRHNALPNCYGSHRAMTQSEIDALDRIGFDWEKSLERRGNRDALDSTGFSEDPPAVKRNPYFWEKLEELKKFKEKNGHLAVKKSKNKQLYDFCCNQKMRYIAHPRGYRRNRPMSEEEKDALDAIGFAVWTQRQPST